jgi:excinuclease ABC subunit A
MKIHIMTYNIASGRCYKNDSDIGPEGGDRGGTVIAQGTPEEVAEMSVSYTGKYIRKMLDKDLRK